MLESIRGREAIAEAACERQNLGLLRLTLDAAVPLLIEEIRRIGGPTRGDYDFCREFAWELGGRGDILLFRGGKRGETAELVNRLISAIAVMAFQPGGVNALGLHFEA